MPQRWRKTWEKLRHPWAELKWHQAQRLQAWEKAEMSLYPCALSQGLPLSSGVSEPRAADSG